MYSFIPLIASGLCSSVASIFLRLAGTQKVQPDFWLFGPTGLRLAAVGAYGVGFVLYAVALRRLPVNVAYPFMVAVTVISLAIYGGFVEHSVQARQLAGGIAIIFGVWLLVWK